MKRPQRSVRWRSLGPVLLIALVGLSLLRVGLGERPIDTLGPRALLDALFTLLAATLVVLIASGVGRRVLAALRLHDLARLEQWVFAVPIGLGILAYGVFVLGLLGLLQAWALALWIAFAGVLTWREVVTALSEVKAGLRDGPNAWRRTSRGERALLIALGVLFALTLLHTLTPPWDADSLLYHLQGPRLFVQAGRVQHLPENWLTSYPFLVQMLYALGLSFGSDSFARVMNLVFAVLLSLTTFALTRRLLDRQHAYIAVAVLIGIPIMPIWAGLAYVDMAWAVYTLLGIYAVLLWRNDRGRSWLIVAGISLGFAVSTKYFALSTAGLLGLWIVWNGLRRGWRAWLIDGVIYGGMALLIAAPWFLKNWLWTGSPLYPILLASNDPLAGQVRLWTQYMNSFGTGRGWLDYVLLPLNIYARYVRFGTFLGNIEIANPLYLLLVMYPWTTRPRQLNVLIGLAATQFVVWAASVQQTRYLLPLFPLLSILTSVVLVDGISRFRRRWRTLAMGLTAGMMTVTIIYSLIFVFNIAPYQVVSGAISKDTFLRRTVADYAALRFIQTELPAQSRVLMLWDGCGYYCDERCLPDVDHSRWTTLVETYPTVDALAAELRRLGVTHLLMSVEAADFMLQHDPTGAHLHAAQFFANEFRPACTREVFTARDTTVYELTCP